MCRHHSRSREMDEDCRWDIRTDRDGRKNSRSWRRGTLANGYGLRTCVPPGSFRSSGSDIRAQAASTVRKTPRTHGIKENSCDALIGTARKSGETPGIPIHARSSHARPRDRSMKICFMAQMTRRSGDSDTGSRVASLTTWAYWPPACNERERPWYANARNHQSYSRSTRMISGHYR